jgi:hypothetical protein
LSQCDSRVAIAFCQMACSTGDSGAKGSSTPGSDASSAPSCMREPATIEITTYMPSPRIASSGLHTRSRSGVALYRCAASVRARMRRSPGVAASVSDAYSDSPESCASCANQAGATLE